jgi:hypothetical protein
MLSFLELPEGSFTAGKLQFLEPEKWKNVGVSLVHALRVIIDH